VNLSDEADSALFALLTELQRLGYRFITPTPATHRRVIRRPDMARAKDLRGIFGWSLPFEESLLSAALLDLLSRAQAIETENGLLRSKVRVSSLGSNLFLHSAYPTSDPASVFFGPDSYRFANLLRAELPRAGGARRLVDLGTGSGVGAIAAAPLLPGARITLTDINPLALRLAAVNSRHAGVDTERVEARSVNEVDGLIDLVVANPPYVIDKDERTYRHGGDMHGARLSLDWSLESAARLSSGGRMILYTGSAIVDGRDALHEALAASLPSLGCALRYWEMDPDVFGEELSDEAYCDVERIAVVAAVIEKRA
jgi:Methyltransferase small domain